MGNFCSICSDSESLAGRSSFDSTGSHELLYSDFSFELSSSENFENQELPELVSDVESICNDSDSKSRYEEIEFLSLQSADFHTPPPTQKRQAKFNFRPPSLENWIWNPKDDRITRTGNHESQHESPPQIPRLIFKA